jgi:hypothetical protein
MAENAATFGSMEVVMRHLSAMLVVSVLSCGEGRIDRPPMCRQRCDHCEPRCVDARDFGVADRDDVCDDDCGMHNLWFCGEQDDECVVGVE